MAELAAELLGAKLTSEIVREAWQSASPDAKRAIADALLERVKNGVKSESVANDWSVRSFLETIVKELLEEQKPRYMAIMRPMVEAAMKTFTPDAVSKAVQDFTHSTLAAVSRMVVDEYTSKMFAKIRG